jgi:tRNA(adenine34) deaminase
MINFMEYALLQAKKAYKNDEVPIGAVIVKDNKIIARAYNKTIKNKDALSHAEIICIKKACKVLKDFRLNDCDMYVTLEPCLMCAGAILSSRIKTLYYGANNEKYGFITISKNVYNINVLNHSTKFVGPTDEKECGEILKEFFKNKRI